MNTRREAVALVTGAAAGLGREIALALAGSCRAVGVHYRRSAASARETAAAIRERGAQSAVFAADLARAGGPARLVGAVERRFGRLDILVNNVGPFLQKPWDELTFEDWDAAMRGNLYAAYGCLQAVLPGLRKRGWGRIINIGYGRAEQLAAFPGILPYAAAKTALLLLTRTAAAGEAGSRITVNMVSPGLLRGGVLPGGQDPKSDALGTFIDVAEAVRFLVSEKAARISGTNLIVAGTWKM
jgi:3-oxoacyl-[acyl-carrier protein] reductase